MIQSLFRSLHSMIGVLGLLALVLGMLLPREATSRTAPAQPAVAMMQGTQGSATTSDIIRQIAIPQGVPVSQRQPSAGIWYVDMAYVPHCDDRCGPAPRAPPIKT
ncbi:MAG TPA: hypothetical protein VGC40_10380 [Paenirhodobacter sp.]